jgi:hypothetical protein
MGPSLHTIQYEDNLMSLGTSSSEQIVISLGCCYVFELCTLNRWLVYADIEQRTRFTKQECDIFTLQLYKRRHSNDE